jgi:hypothetical protein
MKKKPITILFILIAITLISCAGQNNAVFIPEPDFSVFASNKIIEIGDIIETKGGGVSKESLPEWLLAFISGGIEEVETITYFSDKYVFIAVNQDDRFAVLSKWAENFSAAQDFTILAANRIEERMLLTASLYPEDEYGVFFRELVKNAYGFEYRDAEKEETFWIKHSPPGTFIYFVLITIDKNSMQSDIRNMMAQVNTSGSLTRSQAASVNRLRQNFFEGF